MGDATDKSDVVVVDGKEMVNTTCTKCTGFTFFTRPVQCVLQWAAPDGWADGWSVRHTHLPSLVVRYRCSAMQRTGKGSRCLGFKSQFPVMIEAAMVQGKAEGPCACVRTCVRRVCVLRLWCPAFWRSVPLCLCAFASLCGHGPAQSVGVAFP